jgi:hypothetical protein
VTRVQQRDAQSQLLNETSNTLATLELDSTGTRVCTTACNLDNLNGRRHFPYVATSVNKVYNLANGVLETSVQSDTTYDANGNVTRLTVATMGPQQNSAWVKDTVNTYSDSIQLAARTPDARRSNSHGARTDPDYPGVGFYL